MPIGSSSLPIQFAANEGEPPLVCFSHLHWDFVFQRPQHLMTRFARTRTVIYWEEPAWLSTWAEPTVSVRRCETSGVLVARPQLSHGTDDVEAVLARLLDGLLAERGVQQPVLWYYTPMMLAFSRHLTASAVVYDCMDELSAFKFAPPELLGLETDLLARADVVFTGGYSLWEAKRDRHRNIHPFPSSVDRAHFAQARTAQPDTADQAALPHPRLGFYGVVDERMDLSLLAAVADAHPEWSLCIVGPVVKIDDADLPRRPNLHYLGGKSYAELPSYIAGWDVALMPFAINEHTRFISPTKTPEYLAGGRPVVSTPIVDVKRHYGDLQGVRIATTPDAFIAECEAALAMAKDGPWLDEVDVCLAELSWDETFRRMSAQLDAATPSAALAADTSNLIVSPAVRPSNRRKSYDYMVVGAGFAGSVLAERLAAGSNKRVLVVDRRPHIAGNAYDLKDAAGGLIHQYGPHIFHTNSQDIVDYLSRFTRWRPYEHRVLGQVRGQLVPIPINRTTLNTLYGLDLQSDEQAAAYLATRAEPVDTIRTSEDVVVSAVGQELYELFFRGYTRKQWGMDPSELDKSVTARVPTRTNIDDRYFTDTFQNMPADGYTRMFENILDHPNISIELGVDYADVKREVNYDQLVFTGPIDEYFGFRYGRLPYRSLEFRHETHDCEQYQSVGTVNYPAEDVPYTRISEYKHLTGQVHAKTSITYEFPRAEGDPYYPVPRPENQALFKKYEALAQREPDVHFAGRLATYRYYNMDQVVGQALATYRRIAQAEGRSAANYTPAQAAMSA